MLFLRNVSFFRTTYLFFLNLCGLIVYGWKAVERPRGDDLLATGEVKRIRRINSELEIGPQEWERDFDLRTHSSTPTELEFNAAPRLYTFREMASCFCDAGEALAGDSLTAAFSSAYPEPWNFMQRTAGPGGIPWLFLPLWLVGVWVRYFVLFPMRLGILSLGTAFFAFCFMFVQLLLPECLLKNWLRKRLQCFLASTVIASVGGVVRYHGTRPKRQAHQIFVANHTSLIDEILLTKAYPFSLTGQRYGGLVGLFQDMLRLCQEHIWFELTSRKDGESRQRLVKVGCVREELFFCAHDVFQKHTANPKNEPLLLFPEGTYVNNEYCLMFKPYCFGLGLQVYPVAIKYHKQFSDPYWHSTQVSFLRHLLDLMTSWALVADVYYLEPQQEMPSETPTQFALRVRQLICEKADLIDVKWDGVLKRNRISPSYKEQRQGCLADVMKRRLRISSKSASSSNLIQLTNPNQALGEAVGHRKRNSVMVHQDSPLKPFM